MLIVYVDMDDTVCDYKGAYEAALVENPGMPFPQSQYRFFANLEPIQGGVETVKALLGSDRFDPYILSAPSTRNPFSYTEKREWVERHFGLEFCGRLILCENKALLRGDILIDDYASGKGQEHFEGKLMQFASADYPDWSHVRQALGIPEELKDNCRRCGREIPYDGRYKPICRPCVEELEEENSLLSKTYAAHDPRRSEAYNAGVEAGKAGWRGPRLPEEKELREFWYEGYEEGIRLRRD